MVDFCPSHEDFHQRTRRSWVTGRRAWIEFGGIGHTGCSRSIKLARGGSRDSQSQVGIIAAAGLLLSGACALWARSWVERRARSIAQARF
jgi:hypothetical protein